MKKIAVQVRGDHLEALARSRSASDALAELIWNSLDADAKTVKVQLVANALSGLDTIILRDDGHGLPFDDAEPAFSNLGGSWKLNSQRTRGGGVYFTAGKGVGAFAHSPSDN